jgi:NAD/NADP transhydrogenase beta subunit
MEQQPYTPYPVPPYPAPRPPVPGKGLGIAGMVLGICGAALWWTTLWVSLPCAIVGLVLSVIAMKKAKEAGMKNAFAVTGLVLSIVGLAFNIIFFAAAIAESNRNRIFWDSIGGW